MYIHYMLHVGGGGGVKIQIKKCVFFCMVFFIPVILYYNLQASHGCILSVIGILS
jgi:hypothetical protein